MPSDPTALIILGGAALFGALSLLLIRRASARMERAHRR